MPNWNELFNEVKAFGSAHDVLRRKYLRKLHEVTIRNIIVCCSGWLQKQGIPGAGINDEDKNGFMNAVNGLDRSLGLDLILHTPGGETAATEFLVDYLRDGAVQPHALHAAAAGRAECDGATAAGAGGAEHICGGDGAAGSLPGTRRLDSGKTSQG